MVTMMNPIDEQPATDSTSTHPSPLPPPSSGTNPPSQPSQTEEAPGSNGVVYWLDGRTGDQLTVPPSSSHARFMRSTYAATCRAHLSRSIERCPRAMRGIHVRRSFSLSICVCSFRLTPTRPVLTIGVLRMLFSNCRVLRVRSRVSSGNETFRPFFL